MVNKYVILHICQNLHILHCVSFYTETQGGVQAFAPEAPSLLILGVAPPTMMSTILILLLVDLHTSMLCPSVCSVFLVPVHSWFLQLIISSFILCLAFMAFLQCLLYPTPYFVLLDSPITTTDWFALGSFVSLPFLPLIVPNCQYQAEKQNLNWEIWWYKKDKTVKTCS